MADQENLFTEQTPTTPSSSDLFSDKLKTITREDGTPKYETVDAALEALPNAMSHIATLEAERKADKEKLEAMQEQILKLGSVDDFVSKLAAAKEEPKAVETQQTAGLSEEAVLSLIERTRSEQSVKVQQDENQQQVVQKLVQTFGSHEKAHEIINSRAKELGMTPESWAS